MGSRTTSLACAIAALALASHARADAPPPDGKKYVDFRFTVENLAAFPDYVMLAYPTSLSNGAPTYELSLVEEGKPVGLGRRSETPKLYAVKKADFETFRASYKPENDRSKDPALEAFLASDKAVACDQSPSRVGVLPASDARNTVDQTLRVVSIAPGSCHLEAKAIPMPPKAAGCACQVGAAPDTTPAWGALCLALPLAVGARRRRRAR